MKILLLLISLLFASSSNASDVKNTELCLRDCKMELQFFRKYAREGSSIANLALAIMNYRGQGKEINIEQGNKFLYKAAQGGEPTAQYQLGYFLMNGMYFEKNLDRALGWFKKAARYDILDSHKRVAYLTQYMESYDAPVNSLESAANNLIVSDLKIAENPSRKEKNVAPSLPTTYSNMAQADEVIKIIAIFNWADVLDAAKQQTCKHETCFKPVLKALVPRIVIESDMYNESKVSTKV